MQEHAPHYQPQVCVTAQHREMLDQVLEVFSVKPDYDLNIMLPGQSLFESTTRILSGLEGVLRARLRLGSGSRGHNDNAVWISCGVRCTNPSRAC